MLPRIPLPFKVFLSYFFVLAVGALPLTYYLQDNIQKAVMNDAATRMSETLRNLSRQLASMSKEERLQNIEKAAPFITERMTLLDQTGRVLFDSTHGGLTPNLPNHGDRLEVQLALGEVKEPRLDFDPRIECLGISKRLSETNQVEMLYVAVCLRNASGAIAGILRFATPTSHIESLASAAFVWYRNAEALSMTAAIFFSFLAAVVFSRPLQNVVKTTNKLANGDFFLPEQKENAFSNDEIGDVNFALMQMSVHLRRRLAIACDGLAVAAQLADALRLPCIIFETNNTVVAINAAARQMLRVEGEDMSRPVETFLNHPILKKALSEAENDAEPEHIQIDMPAGQQIAGRVHIVKRPGSAPLQVFLGDSLVEMRPSKVPNPLAVRTLSMSSVIETLRDVTHESLEQVGVTLMIVGEIPQVSITDVDQIAENVLENVLLACVEGMAERDQELGLTILVEDTRVGCYFDVEPERDALDVVAAEIEPLGGGIKVSTGGVTLWLPRA